jgi:adenylylsulfate kinase-like enzyme
MQDSFFVADPDSRRGGLAAQGGLDRGFDRLDAARSSSRMAPLPDDVGGIVIDTPVSPLRH